MIIFSWPTIEKSFVKFFSGSSGLSYWSKACSIRSGLSIAPTLDRFGRVQVKNDTIEKRWRPVSQFPPLKKKRTAPDRIRRVEATNDANKERSNPVSQSVPLKKKNAQLVRLIPLISPVKILNNMIHPKSLKNFLGRLFDDLS